MKTIFKVVGSIIGACGLSFASGEIAIAGVQDIRVLSRNNNGSFLSICQDGDTETVSAYEIRENLVCRDNVEGNGSNSGNAGTASLLACTRHSRDDRFYITKVASNEKLGGNLPLEQCRQLISAASDELICIRHSREDRFYLTRISDVERLGGYTILSTCLQLLEDTVVLNQ